MSTKTIFIHFAEGFEEVEAITPIDVLRRAGCEVVTISVTGNKLVSSVRGVTIETDSLFDDVDYSKGDMILLPGGMPGAKNLNEHSGLKSKIMDYFNNGKYLAAICAAPIVFGNLGLLKGKRATCYPGFEEHLKRAKIVTDKVVVDGNIITGKGPGAAMAFSLKIAEVLTNSKETVKQVAEAMIVDF